MYARSGMRPATLLVLAHLDELDAGVTGEQPLVVLDVIDVRRAQTADGDDGDLHEAGY